MHHATRWAMLLTIALAVVIAALTLTPPMPVEMPVGSDKSHHFIAFVALALPLATIRPRWSAVLFVVFSAYGAAIEVIQPFVGRSRELADLAAHSKFTDPDALAAKRAVIEAALQRAAARGAKVQPKTRDDET